MTESGLTQKIKDVGEIHEFPLHRNQVFGRILRKSYEFKKLGEVREFII